MTAQPETEPLVATTVPLDGDPSPTRPADRSTPPEPGQAAASGDAGMAGGGGLSAADQARIWQMAGLLLLSLLLVAGGAAALLAATGWLAPRLPPPQVVAPGSFPPGFAYVDVEGVWAISADGRQRARLLAAERGGVWKGPAWWPGRDQIVFAATRPYQRNANNGTDLRAVAWDGSGERLVVEHDAVDHHLEWPAFSADGRYLYFGHSYPVRDGGAFRGERADLERLDLTTGNRTRLVEGASQPSVSADGATLAFLRHLPSGTVQLWTARGDGSAARPAIAGEQEFPYYYSPRLSPNGRTIAVSVTGAPGPRRTVGAAERWLARLNPLAAETAQAHGGGPWEIVLVDVASGTTRRLVSASSAGDEMSLAWSADSAQLVYLTRGALGTVEVAGDQHTLLSQAVGLGDVIWPPPGNGATAR